MPKGSWCGMVPMGNCEIDPADAFPVGDAKFTASFLQKRTVLLNRSILNILFAIVIPPKNPSGGVANHEIVLSRDST